MSRFSLIRALDASPLQSSSSDKPLKRTEWTVDNLKRVAWVHLPANPVGKPIVFLWAGHGQNPIEMVRNFSYHTLWPEAIIVYPQGLPTPGWHSDPKGLLPGWQFQPGQFQDRDIKFFDAMLKTAVQEWRADEKSVLSTGHSNGGRLTYLLWSLRGTSLAAVAPIATTAEGLFTSLKPKPCLHIAGEGDTLVPFAAQKETMEWIKKRNECQKTGKVWEKKRMQTVTLYPSANGNPFVEYVYAGGHELPKDAPRLILKFFKDEVRK